MLTQQRRQYILDLLQQDGEVVAKVLAQQWSISEDTIRRDLREMDKQGLLQRVHGGALPRSPALADLATRSTLCSEEKQLIARHALTLIQPGDMVVLDGGTTTLALCQQIPASLRATFVTHSPPIAMALAQHPLLDVVLLGGRLYRHSMVAVGGMTLETIQQLQPDLYFMGASSISCEQGASTGDPEEALIKRALARQARACWLLASSEKFDTHSPCQILPASQLPGLIVSPQLSVTLRERLQQLGCRIQVAGQGVLTAKPSR